MNVLADPAACGLGWHNLRLGVVEQLARQHHQQRLLVELAAENPAQLVAVAAVLLDAQRVRLRELLAGVDAREDLPAWSDHRR